MTDTEALDVLEQAVEGLGCHCPQCEIARAILRGLRQPVRIVEDGTPEAAALQEGLEQVMAQALAEARQ